MSNIAISDLTTQAESLTQDDLLLVSKSDPENNTFTSAKVKWSVIDNLINNKISNLISTVTNLRETINNIVNSDGTEQEESLEYCKLDGNLGILGTDISNYDNVTKWEFKIQHQLLTDEQKRRYDSVHLDNSFIYEYNEPETSSCQLFYNLGQYRNISKKGKFKFIEFYNNDNSTQLVYSIDAYREIINGSYSGNIYYIGRKFYESVITATELYEQPIVLTYNKTSNTAVLNNYTHSSFEYSDTVTSGTTSGYVDHLLSTANWRWGIYGRVYYIKGYNSSNEVIANLTPKMKNNYIYMYDSVGQTNIQFRGSGSALAPVS